MQATLTFDLSDPTQAQEYDAAVKGLTYRQTLYDLKELMRRGKTFSVSKEDLADQATTIIHNTLVSNTLLPSQEV